MARIIAISNQKGGVGKTTTTINLAAMLASAGKRILVVDLDPQGNTSSVFTPTYDGPSALRGGLPQGTGRARIAVIPSGPDLLQYERDAAVNQEGKLKQVLAPFHDEFDVVLVDCPPSLSILPLNALIAAQGLIVPIQCEYYAMEGLGQILAAIAEAEEEGKVSLAWTRVLLCMFDGDLDLSRQVSEEVRKHLADQVLQTMIPRDVAIAAAPSHRHSILEHDPLCPGALAYLQVAKELLSTPGLL